MDDSPEGGTQFWQDLSNGTELTFANWNGSEPNNLNGEEYANIAAALVIGGVASIRICKCLPITSSGALHSRGY